MIDDESAEIHYVKFLVLGGGNAAGYVANEFIYQQKFNEISINWPRISNEAIRTDSEDSQKASNNQALLTIISVESIPPYERPMLTKGYISPSTSFSTKKQPEIEDMLTCQGSGQKKQDLAWYQENKIDLFLNHKIYEVDVETHSVLCTRLRDQKQVQFLYDKLIVATGTRPLFSLQDKTMKNIFTLRKIYEAQDILNSLQTMKNNNKSEVIIVGGGYIGLETAAAIVGWNYKVTLIFPEHRLMTKVFTEKVSYWYENYLNHKNIKIIKNTKIKKFIKSKENKNQVGQVLLENGEYLKCDLAVVGVGVTDNTEIFESQLAFGHYYVRGVKTNRYLTSSDSNVFVVGDVAAVPFNRGYHRFEHVHHARATAKVAVKNMLIESHNFVCDVNVPRVVHNYTPFYYSTIFEYTDQPISFVFYGHTGDDQTGIRTYEFGDHKRLKPSPLTCLWVDNSGMIIGGLLCNGTITQNQCLKTYVKSRKKYTNQVIEIFSNKASL